MALAGVADLELGVEMGLGNGAVKAFLGGPLNSGLNGTVRRPRQRSCPSVSRRSWSTVWPTRLCRLK